MTIRLLAFCLILSSIFSGLRVRESRDYFEYHSLIAEAEWLIVEDDIDGALAKYEDIFARYDFVFLRDYKVAAQLAVFLNQKKKAFELIKRGLSAGWELKEIKRNQFLKPLLKDPDWRPIEQSYDQLYDRYEMRIDADLREQVRQMFKRDQKKAMGALFRIGNGSQEKYGSEKFAPHSEMQILELLDILDTKGYPGEKLIDNNFWMSTIISHHNSISKNYVRNDTLFDHIKPRLLKAIEDGEMSPYEYALVDDWKKAVAFERRVAGYGYLISPKDSTLEETNLLRKKIGLRSIELRNKLVEIENKTGMNFYLPDWIDGKIDIE